MCLPVLMKLEIDKNDSIKFATHKLLFENMLRVCTYNKGCVFGVFWRVNVDVGGLGKYSYCFSGNVC